MAKGSRGGKRASGSATVLSGVAQQQQAQAQNQQTQSQVDTTQTPNAMSTSYQHFMAMSDDDKADAIANLAKTPVPTFLADNDFQKMTYALGLNDKPTMVDDSVLDSMGGTELFRTINSVYDRRNDIGYDADFIASQVQKGTVTRVSDSGGSAYGRGLYFSNDYGGSSAYGNVRGNISKTAVVRAKLNSNAKVLNYYTAQNMLSSEIRSGSKLGKALNKIKANADAVSIYALAKGYNVLVSGSGVDTYHNVLNRNALTMSKTIKAKSTKW